MKQILTKTERLIDGPISIPISIPRRIECHFFFQSNFFTERDEARARLVPVGDVVVAVLLLLLLLELLELLLAVLLLALAAPAASTGAAVGVAHQGAADGHVEEEAGHDGQRAAPAVPLD